MADKKTALKETRFLCLILLASLAVRLVFSFDNNKALFLDIEVFKNEANLILDSGLSALKMYHAPLYPLFIAGVFGLFGRSLIYVYIVQSLLGTANTFLIYIIGKNAFDKRIGLISAALSLLYWPLQLYSGILLSETLFIFLIMLGVYCSLKALDSGKLVFFAAAGASFALATLTRSISMLLIGVIPVVYLIYRRDKLNVFLRNALAFVISFIIVMSPWTIRNYILFDEFIPVDALGGLNLYVGNNERSNGFYINLTKQDLEEGIRKYTKAGQQNQEVEVNDKTLKEATFTYILQNPGRFIRLTIWRIVLFINLDFRDVDWVLQEYMREHAIFHYAFLRMLVYISDIIFFLLGMFGFGELLKIKKCLILAGFIAYFALLTSLFYIAERYRLPIMPFLSIAAAFKVPKWNTF
ncbi:MAG: glycosyltransferase family 39 protein [Eubacteriales bacterium]|nr:glycosyltransferase family 39 protein [Eubacteriales bacterium]